MRRMVTLAMGLLLLFAAAAPSHVTATEPIRVLDEGHENNFPASLRFRLKAEGEAQITQATLQYKTDDRAVINFSPAKLTPGRQVSVDHQLDLRRFYQPPGVDLRYRWQLRDANGQTLETPWLTFTLDDPRFDWRVLKADNLELRWYKGGDEFGGTLLAVGREALAKLKTEAGVEGTRRVRIFIYANEQDFQSAVDPGTHEWAGGRAFPREGVILIAASANELPFARRTVPHELSHVIVYQATKNPYGGLPNWLDEGLAMVAEGNQSPSFAGALRSAVAENRLISVWALSSSFPTDTRQAELSYAESHSVVGYVLKKYGRDGVSRLLAQFREGASYDDALKAALGIDTYALDDAWRASLGLAPGAPTPVASVTVARLALTPVRATPTTPPTTTAPTNVVAPSPVPSTISPTPVPTVAIPSAGVRCALPALALIGGIGGLTLFSRRRSA